MKKQILFSLIFFTLTPTHSMNRLTSGNPSPNRGTKEAKDAAKKADALHRRCLEDQRQKAKNEPEQRQQREEGHRNHMEYHASLKRFTETGQWEEPNNNQLTVRTIAPEITVFGIFSIYVSYCAFCR